MAIPHGGKPPCHQQALPPTYLATNGAPYTEGAKPCPIRIPTRGITPASSLLHRSRGLPLGEAAASVLLSQGSGGCQPEPAFSPPNYTERGRQLHILALHTTVFTNSYNLESYKGQNMNAKSGLLLDNLTC